MRAVLCLSVLGVLAAACGGSGGSAVTPKFLLPGTAAGSNDDFYSLPFPNDLLRKADGTPDLSGFPQKINIIAEFVAAAETLDGFGLNSAIYTRFDGALDAGSFPTIQTSVTDPTASVYLVNVDKASPDYNTRTPIIPTFVADAGRTIGDNRLVVRPFPGFGLDEGTTYAMVVTDRVIDVNGNFLAAAPAMSTLLGASGDAAYAPLRAWLASDGAADNGHVTSAAVFTTQHIHFILPAIRAGVMAAPAPVSTDVAAGTRPSDGWKEFVGTYMAPNLQSGNAPYTSTGGEILVGSDGNAVVQYMENMRFAMTIPNGAVPKNGFPYAIYQHGTGGDYESFIDDGTADRLAGQGIAVISTDNVLNSVRDPSNPSGDDFFNFTNPYAARDNALQGVADAYSQMRLANALTITDAGSGSDGSDARTITVDPSRLMFFGHSQGGLTGPGFVASEPSVKGAVFSGTGGILYLSALLKANPVDFKTLLEALLDDSSVDETTPELAMLQEWLERADPANMAPLMVRQLLPGVTTPRNIFQSEGFVDSYAPNQCIEAFATALGGDLVMTQDFQVVNGLELRGRAIKPPPFSNNLDGATAVLAQYDEAPNSDGHFVVFEVPDAEQQSSQFLGTLAGSGVATVVVPQ